jgi:hypothetical protein
MGLFWNKYLTSTYITILFKLIRVKYELTKGTKVLAFRPRFDDVECAQRTNEPWFIW